MDSCVMVITETWLDSAISDASHRNTGILYLGMGTETRYLTSIWAHLD